MRGSLDASKDWSRTTSALLCYTVPPFVSLWATRLGVTAAACWPGNAYNLYGALPIFDEVGDSNASIQISMDNLYEYEPLKLELQEIRLLKISNSQITHTISCHIVHFSLLSEPSYEALSYTWKESTMFGQVAGTPKDGHGTDRLIEVDGSNLRVFENVYSAMSTLASYAKGFLWIDAICIDQENMKEREHQVGLMGRIFSGAERVIAWLGPSSPCSSTAISFLRSLSSCPTGGDHHSWVMDTAKDARSLDSWIGLFNLVKRDWWTRVWVIQEYVLGQDVIFLCGEEIFDAQTLDRALKVLHDCWGNLFATSTLKQIGFNARVMDPLWNLHALRHRLRQRNIPPVPTLTHLSLTRAAHSTDPRDRLFAQYGLMSEKVRELCPPNYSLPEIDIFTIFFRNYVQYTRDLSILCHAGMDSKTAQAWPTWLAQWTPGRHVYPFHCDWTGRRNAWPVFNACGDLTNPDFEITSEHVLRCKGVIVDEVDGVQLDTWCKEPWEDPKGNPSSSDNCAYEGPDAVFEALWRTIVADTNRRFSTGDAVLCVPERAPHKFALLFAASCQEYDEVLDSREEAQGVMPKLSPPGCSNIERRWHGMRELKLGGTRLREVIPQNFRSSASESPSGNKEPVSTRTSEWQNFEGSYGQVFYRRRLFTTVQGRLGVSTRSLKTGDKVCIIWGCPIPIVLRYSQTRFELVGDTYVHGIMMGEGVVDLTKGSSREITLDIN